MARGAPVPNTQIQLRNRRLGTLTARGGSGSTLPEVEAVWGAPDQIDDYDIFLTTRGRNYTYVNLGLVFVADNSGGSYRVSGVIFFDPYFGTTDIGTLRLRGTRSQFDAALVSTGCASSTSSFLNQSWIVYRVAATAGSTACDIRVGVVFDSMSRATMMFLGFPSGV